MGLRMAHGFVIALATVASCQPLAAQTPLPPPIQRLLAANPRYRLLAVADVRDIVDQGAEEYFTPFASGDLTGDGVPEVAAVIVQRGTSIRFGVVVAHGSRTVHWVLRPQSDKIERGDSADSAALYQALPRMRCELLCSLERIELRGVSLDRRR